MRLHLAGCIVRQSGACQQLSSCTSPSRRGTPALAEKLAQGSRGEHVLSILHAVVLEAHAPCALPCQLAASQRHSAAYACQGLLVSCRRGAVHVPLQVRACAQGWMNRDRWRDEMAVRDLGAK